MKYVALLSGGKDSCYNLSHCNANGYQLVAAATLSPQSGKDEIDSYMYQTVGQDAIEFVARALEVPLYRHVIQGDAIEQNAEYGSRSAGGAGVLGDETEDLYTLLKRVKVHHPDVQGVAVGAILSNYQRVRVEHVCRRLSLTPLAYLWQRDQAELLSEMIAAGVKSVLIKVAGIGLTVKHLGKTLNEMQDTLTRLNNLYGLHICGEGGEYETLTLDSPSFKHRIALDGTEVVMHTDNDFAPVAYLRIKQASLHPKESYTDGKVEIPPLLDDRFGELKNVVETSVLERYEKGSSGTYEPINKLHHIPGHPSTHAIGSWLAIGNIHPDSSLDSEIPLEEQVRDCFIQLQGILQSHDLCIEDVANITLLLPSLAPKIFAAANKAYAEFFGVSPPSRACVGVDLPEGVRVILECVARKDNTRRALHVQSLSYWAPANIGPYSQAVTVEPYVFVSGQIGLLPASLTLPSPSSLALETALVFQHTERVIRAANTAGGHVLLSLYWLVDYADTIHTRRACETFCEETPTLFLVVASLPRGARIEKQVLVHTGKFTVLDEDTFIQVSHTPEFVSGDIHAERTQILRTAELLSGV
ncbi:meiotically up-regulated 71 protein [Suillus fuscotomentosus]|uniref:Diphthine--ammonia ligase n=1 Tax=Suillus fuscotomentosus TaxID=1912939 RepID=A0AAD4HSL4_9AGAM|nr:meiotically up-regulated 71 protein [Suillus fuscotomentosus]KAG1907061.1 meiotically up-regulated 71 protein [Suillus fuscotomentosus]